MVKPSDIAAGAFWQTAGQTLGQGDPPEVIMEVRETVMQVYGKVHGGAIAGLVDSALAIALNAELPENLGAATVELKLNFLRPVTAGTIRARGQVLNRGKLLSVVEAKAWDEEGQLVAAGLGTFRMFELNKE